MTKKTAGKGKGWNQSSMKSAKTSTLTNTEWRKIREGKLREKVVCHPRTGQAIRVILSKQPNRPYEIYVDSQQQPRHRVNRSGTKEEPDQQFLLTLDRQRSRA